MAEPPEWTKDAEHKFTNQHGEVWYAKETEFGLVLTGSDVDWKEYPVYVDGRPYKPPIFDKFEKAWFYSVLGVRDIRGQGKCQQPM